MSYHAEGGAKSTSGRGFRKKRNRYKRAKLAFVGSTTIAVLNEKDCRYLIFLDDVQTMGLGDSNDDMSAISSPIFD